MNDALLAALVAFCVTLLTFLFLPALVEELPGLVVAAMFYMAVLLAVSWIFRPSRRTPRK